MLLKVLDMALKRIRLGDYIERLKEIDKEYSDYNVRKHIIDDSMGEDFQLTYFNANIDNYIECNIPEYLVDKYNIIKTKVQNKC